MHYLNNELNRDINDYLKELDAVRCSIQQIKTVDEFNEYFESTLKDGMEWVTYDDVNGQIIGVTYLDSMISGEYIGGCIRINTAERFIYVARPSFELGLHYDNELFDTLLFEKSIY